MGRIEQLISGSTRTALVVLYNVQYGSNNLQYWLHVQMFYVVRKYFRKYEGTKVLSYEEEGSPYVYVYACVQRTRLHVSDKEGDSGTRAAPPPSGGDGDAEHAHVRCTVRKIK